MKNEWFLRKCNKCGAVVEVVKDCTCDNCGIKCCGETMQKVEPNTVDASIEKHMPEYEVVGQYVVVSVNHEMTDEHYIEYIALDAVNVNAKKYFKTGETAKAVFPYISGSTLYAYCNKHGLWSKNID